MELGKQTERSLLGVSFKHEHYSNIENAKTLPPFFEIISENFMNTKGYPIYLLEKVAQDSSFSMHGVSLSIGSTQLQRHNYMKELKKLVDILNPLVVSDHLCWTGWGDHTTHDLLPLPLNEETLEVVAEGVDRVQNLLKRTFSLENISRYVDFSHSTMNEIHFFEELVKRTGCTILLDVNNVYVNSVNFSFDPYKFIELFPKESVVQYHMAGHTDLGTYLYDTHVGPVPQTVLELYKHTLKTIGQRPTIVEWDTDVPTFDILLEEREKIERLANEARTVTEDDAVCNFNSKSRKPFSKQSLSQIPREASSPC